MTMASERSELAVLNCWISWESSLAWLHLLDMVVRWILLVHPPDRNSDPGLFGQDQWLEGCV